MATQKTAAPAVKAKTPGAYKPNDQIVVFNGVLWDNSRQEVDPETGQVKNIVDKMEARIVYSAAELGLASKDDIDEAVSFLASELGLEVEPTAEGLLKVTAGNETFTLTPKALSEYVLAHAAKTLGYESVAMNAGGKLEGTLPSGETREIDFTNSGIKRLLNQADNGLLYNYSNECKAALAAVGVGVDVEAQAAKEGGELVPVGKWATSPHVTGPRGGRTFP